MKVLGTIFIVILTSLFYFPFATSFLPEANTKMVLAAVGLVLFMYQTTQRHNAEVDSTFASVSAWALLVSTVGLFSALANGSGDYTYASYIVSAWVWMGGAYAVIKCIGVVYGKVTLRLLTNILVTVCVAQCILSQIIDTNASFAEWVDSFMVSTGFMGKAEGRLYGIGCALDVAGLKFCAVLILLAYFAMNPSKKINVYIEISLYVMAFFIISILGSMISRTTSIGVLIVIVYWIWVFLCNKRSTSEYCTIYFWRTIMVVIVLFIPAIIYLYRVDADFYEKLRFGFEGFFSLAETGEWNVSSNDRLMGMWVWPDNIVTWLIGDGYFNSPDINPYYIGPSAIGGYYMGTDIGYCRFVFYFGLIGLAVFCAYFVNCAKQCSKIIPQCRNLFWIILLINFIGWAKVSSDIFPIYALMLMLGKEPVKDSDNQMVQGNCNYL